MVILLGCSRSAKQKSKDANIRTDKTNPSRHESMEEYLHRIYHLRVGVADRGKFATMDWARPRPEDKEFIDDCEFTLITQLSDYNPIFLRTLRLKEVLLCRDLRVNGSAASATEDWGTRVLFIDYYASRNDSAYRAHLVHHELFHCLQFATGHDGDWHIPGWMRANEPGFKYVDLQQARPIAPDEGVLSHPRNGFVDLYAERTPAEDMAELQGCRMVPKEAALLQRWEKTDPYLKRKVDLLAAFMSPFELHIPSKP